MRLTPLDIKKQQFKRAVRGYDRDEVNTFLEMVAEELESLLHERNRQSDEIIRLRTQLQDYQDVEQTLKHALKNTQETALQSLENSRREAEMIIRDAELEAEKIIRDAKVRLAELKNELMVVKAQKSSFARRLRHLLESQLELIGVLELDDLGFGEIDAPSGSTRPAAENASVKTSPAAAPSAAPEAPRRAPVRPVAGPAREFRPVSEAAAAATRTTIDKKETRISDFIT
ncbi:MAG: DivIVA domain-containing protein [candidate division KSB1 bacterium]|nr:DivIVA domain-containing protein [candidate division KSB1 bacterium]MDZ7272939.1 DivIVA domain-containing protein [candidate division KSB1 bacterium]MDZ7284039.1 DivIVA domain-containing protein [candidate division KSB1 bacterium]MDZ7297564.1 DivIVA domain-containing protein [candidate division KSB1 bacterium]MDZ7308960.1 DivIVA domain-containing protein [candidate division KSB1 bacterium]